jgi:hypothetical protein
MILHPLEPVRCTVRRCKALLHLHCLNDHDLGCAEVLRSVAEAHTRHPESWNHVSPPPSMWSHNACGQQSIQEVSGMLLRCVGGLRPLLSPTTLDTLDTLAEQRSQPATITEYTAWQVSDRCGCERCILDKATAQDQYLQKSLYQHMNCNRTLQDQDFEGLGPYRVGSFSDVRRMFESHLDLRTMSHASSTPRDRPLCPVQMLPVQTGNTSSWNAPDECLGEY